MKRPAPKTFTESWERLYDALSARRTLSVTPGEAQLNARGERLWEYLNARMRRRHQDDRRQPA